MFSGKKYIDYILFGYFLGPTGFRDEEFKVFLSNMFFELNYSNSPQEGRKGSRGPKNYKSIYPGPINTCAKFEPNLKGSVSILCSHDAE